MEWKISSNDVGIRLDKFLLQENRCKLLHQTIQQILKFQCIHQNLVLEHLKFSFRLNKRNIFSPVVFFLYAKLPKLDIYFEKVLYKVYFFYR